MPATKALHWLLLPAVAFTSSIRDSGIQDFQHGRFSEALPKLEQAVKADASDSQARLGSYTGGAQQLQAGATRAYRRRQATRG
jgi:hypothetical protein